MQKECDQLNSQLEEIESKQANTDRAKQAAEAALEDTQEQLATETKAKLQLRGKLTISHVETVFSISIEN